MVEGLQNLNSAKSWGRLWIFGGNDKQTTRPCNLFAHLRRGGATLWANWRWFTSQRSLRHKQIYFGKGGNGFKVYYNFRNSNSLWEAERPSTLLLGKASLQYTAFCTEPWILTKKKKKKRCSSMWHIHYSWPLYFDQRWQNEMSVERHSLKYLKEHAWVVHILNN